MGRTVERRDKKIVLPTKNAIKIMPSWSDVVRSVNRARVIGFIRSRQESSL